MKIIKIIIACVVSVLISSCVQNGGPDSTSSNFKRVALSNDYDSHFYNDTYNRATNSHFSEMDQWEANEYEKRSHSRNDSSKRQRHFISKNGETLRDKLESKKQ